MQKMIICKGLPGSGKSTWAKKFVEQKHNEGRYWRVNRDDIRKMLGKYDNFTAQREDLVTAIQTETVRAVLQTGDNVVIDDCNLNPIYESAWRLKAATIGAVVEVQDFTVVPLRECMKRNAGRSGDDRVNNKVILEMYNRWLKPAPPLYIPSYPNCIIVDMDGTLANIGKRSPYDASQCDKLDTLNQAVALIAEQQHACGTRVIIMSGRDEINREPTERFLANNFVKYQQLIMRPKGDTRKDSIIKRELYEKHIAGVYNVLFCLDDRDQVVDLWRSMGLTCFQVADGWF